MKTWITILLVLCSVLTDPSEAGPAEEMAYTRMGAIAGGSATGEIGPWEGAKGLECPSDFQKGAWLPHPYEDEEPLFRIDHTNVEEYKDRLSPGQRARLKRNERYSMNVYPCHRNQEFCEAFYAATERSRKTAYVDENNILQGYQGGVPFPFPKTALEAVWNVKRPYMGDDVYTHECRRVVSPSGKIKKSMRKTLVMIYDERRLFSKVENPDGLSYKIKSMYTYPADEKGTTYLTFGYIDESRLEDAWIYLPTLRRVRRAPTLTGGGQLDGESTMDDLAQEFRGPVNDWNWKLIGRKEMYIPVNNYDIWEPHATDQEECFPGDINPARARYELRRVWVVEGTPRKGLEHPYGRRVGYYDEDTWMPAAGDRYDKRGNLWRMIEFYTAYDYCQKQRLLPANIYLNLESGRYELSGGCRREGTILGVWDSGLKESAFTVQSLRKSGR
jgi:hypothetical protein